MNETYTVNEYRCTRELPYRNPTCFGHLDLSARQGYYIIGTSYADALEQMQERFPGEMNFTVDIWRVDINRT